MPDRVTSATTKLGFGLLLCLGIGYVAVVGGFILFVMMGSHETPLYVKVLVGLGVGGIGLLFFAVLRQRIIESKTDKYKDVEI
ncbi:MAG: hypothetical protein OXG24_05275 [Gammaproteobacteria bacterium]|nr:hypothetical protein [Gammaproteobacteria bacterium]